MEKLKATIQFIDDFGRLVLLTENNKAMIIHAKEYVYLYKKGDEITIARQEGFRRATDWEIITEKAVV